MEINTQRTEQQNKALHLFFEMVAEKLNEAGLDMRVVLKPDVEIPWTKENVKNHLWRPIQELMLNKKSTTEMNTTDPTQIYEVLNRFLAKHGIHVPFPSLETKNEE